MRDPTLVHDLHGRVADALSSWREREEAGGRPLTRDDQRRYASALIAEELDRHARTQIDQGVDPLGPAEEEEVARTIHAMLFELGSLEPLLADP
ncbi:MAG TPA: CpaF family protein, partial [Actinomycetota bacterium]|nr:CpaF family protein [Actinomycetota bacterium]